MTGWQKYWLFWSIWISFFIGLKIAESDYDGFFYMDISLLAFYAVMFYTYRRGGFFDRSRS